jgi:hypothetical protein
VLTYASRYSAVPAADASDLMGQLSRYPNGSGGIVMGTRGPGISGHAFNWFVENGQLQFSDPVLGKVVDLDAFVKGQQFQKLTWVSTLKGW